MKVIKKSNIINFNEYYTQSIIGTNIKEFKLVRQCEHCTWFKIEITEQFKKNTDLHIYTEVSYYAVHGSSCSANSSYAKTEKIESESNGVRRIIFQLDPYYSVNTVKYTVQLADANRRPIPNDYQLEYIIKFFNAASKEELLPFSFNNEIIGTNKKRKLNISFQEVFTQSSNIDKSIYYILAFNPNVYSLDGVNTFSFDNSNVIETYTGKNEGGIVNLQYEVHFIQGVIIGTFVKFLYKNSSEYHVVSYLPKEFLYESIQPNKFFMSTLSKDNPREECLLEKENFYRKYFVIEFNNEAQRDGSRNGREMKISFEAGI